MPLSVLLMNQIMLHQLEITFFSTGTTRIARFFVENIKNIGVPKAIMLIY